MDPEQPTSIDDLQALLDTLVEQYNEHRPHRSLLHWATPATIRDSRPKAVRTHTGHDRDIRIIDATTGELLRELTLDPAKRYQPIPPRSTKP